MASSTSFLLHAQIIDSALPIGAFSHSFGVETLIAEDKICGATSLESFLQNALSGTWSQSDCSLIKGAFFLENDDLWQLDALVDASRVSRETREGMRKMGRQGLKLARALHPHLDFSDLQAAIKEERCAGSWPLIYGVWTRAIGTELEHSVTGYLYSCCAAALGNAVRLSLIGQTAAQTILARLCPLIDAAWQKTGTVDPFEFSSSSPLLEIAQMRHEWLDGRLFMS